MFPSFAQEKAAAAVRKGYAQDKSDFVAVVNAYKVPHMRLLFACYLKLCDTSFDEPE